MPEKSQISVLYCTANIRVLYYIMPESAILHWSTYMAGAMQSPAVNVTMERRNGMIRFLDILSFGLEWGYVLVFFRMLRTFLPLRRNRALRVLAFFACGALAPAVVYSNDFYGLFGVLLGFGAYVDGEAQRRAGLLPGADRCELCDPGRGRQALLRPHQCAERDVRGLDRTGAAYQ